MSPRFRKGLRVEDQFADAIQIIKKDYDLKLPTRSALNYRNSLLYQKLAEPTWSRLMHKDRQHTRHSKLM